jgi:ubiquinone biosynthesis protein
MLGVLEQDAQQLTRLLLRMGAVDWDADTESLERDLHRLITRYYGVAMREVSLSEMLQQGLDTAFRHQVRIPPELVMLARTAIVLEGVVRRLDPELVLVDVAAPFARRFLAERYSPQRLGKDLAGMAVEGTQLIRSFPRHVETLLGQAETGTMTIGLAIRHLEDVVFELDRVANRLAFSVVVAAITIASALLILGGTEAAVWPLPLIGWGLPVAKLGFVIAGLMGMWLLFSILRARGL